MNKTIRAVIFDLGQVMVKVNQRPLMEGLSRLTGKDTEALFGHFHKDFKVFEQYERGRITGMEFYRWAFDSLGLDPAVYTFALHRKLWCSVIERWPAAEALFGAVCHTLPTFVLSNTNDLHWTWIAEHTDLLLRPRAALTSYQTGLFKPGERIYRAALNKFGLDDPASVVFLDDRPENVDGARAVGMVRSFQFDTPKRAAARLRELGLCLPAFGQE